MNTALVNERSSPTSSLLHQRIQPAVLPLPTRQFQTAINMKMGASAKVIGVMSYKRKWKEGRERVTAAAAAGCSLTQLLTQLILFLPEMSNRSSYSPDNTCWLGRATTGMPPDLCNFSEICRGSKVTTVRTSNTMLTKRHKMQLR